MEIFKYGMRLRGVGIGCQPGKIKYWEDADKIKTGYWSYVYYDRQLTKEELKKYDLDFIEKKIK